MRSVSVAIGLAIVCALSAAAADREIYIPYSGIVNGTDGANAVQLRIRNDSAEEISCLASLAHWYSEKIGRAAPGQSVRVELWHDPKTGVLNVLNSRRDRMPVEAIWCGNAGNHHATRSRVDLPHFAGTLPNTISQFCTTGTNHKLECRQQTN